MRYIYIILMVITCTTVNGQSKTTEALDKRYDESLSLFFYNNTLRMLNQKEDKELDELIKDIEKLRFLAISKDQLNGNDYKKLVTDYKAESFEEMMTSRHEGKNFDVYMKEGGSKGMVITVRDDNNLYVLDIVGSIPLNKVTKLFTKIDESSEVGKKIRDFTSHKH
jgi:hypothetical protein